MVLSHVDLQKAAQNLKPVVPIKFHISSRTDSGVHALCNAAHLDIQRAPGKPAFQERELIRGLNHHLKSEPIRWVSGKSKPFISPLLEKREMQPWSPIFTHKMYFFLFCVGKSLPCTSFHYCQTARTFKTGAVILLLLGDHLCWHH